MSRPATARNVSDGKAAGIAVTSARDKLLAITVGLGLALAVWLAFGESLRNGFVNYDDNRYVYENAVVQQGVTLSGIRWALTYGEIGHWHPLTWISHMLDCQLFGLKPWGHHLTSVLIHMVTAVLLFLVLRRMTGSLWRSAFVAAVFAVHPLRVESVVWVSERKDVLGALGFVLTVGAYVKYVRQPSRLRYALVAGVYAAGLLCKNMLVTLPFVLLLLDYWPLKRFTIDDLRLKIGRLVAEKIPLLVLSAASCVATFLAPEELAAARLPFFLRIENALVSYVAYLRQTFWPTGLAGLYSNPVNALPAGEVVLALMLLLIASAAVFVGRRKRPYLLVGWLWYLGMLVPVIGLVQISFYARADRYTYLPHVGICLLVTWLAGELSSSWRHRRLVLGLASAVIIPVLIFCTRKQTGYWRDSEIFWRQTLAVTAGNSIAHHNLALTLQGRGRTDEAIVHQRRTVEIDPRSAGSRYSLGSTLDDAGQVEEAMAQLKTALEIEPGHVQANVRLGNIFYRIGEVTNAISHYQRALEADPSDALAHNNLGSAMEQTGDIRAAVVHFEKALALLPGMVLASDNLAWVYATCPETSIRNGVRAMALAEIASRSSAGNNPLHLRTLAAAYAENGRHAQAVATAQRAERLAAEQNLTEQVEAIRGQIRLYEAGKPYRDVELSLPTPLDSPEPPGAK